MLGSVCLHSSQLFYSFFKTLVGKEIVVELKNGERRTVCVKEICVTLFGACCAAADALAAIRAQILPSEAPYTLLTSTSISSSSLSVLKTLVHSLICSP